MCRHTWNVITEIVALAALLMAGYGAYIAFKWDRRASRLLVDGGDRLQDFLEHKGIQEYAVRILTAAFVNTYRGIVMIPEHAEPLNKMLKEHGPSLAEGAARGYVLGKKEGVSPGRALANVRRGRGTTLISEDDPITAAINQFAPVMIERFMAGKMGGLGTGFTGEAAAKGAAGAAGATAPVVNTTQNAGWMVPK